MSLGYSGQVSYFILMTISKSLYLYLRFGIFMMFITRMVLEENVGYHLR